MALVDKIKNTFFTLSAISFFASLGFVEYYSFKKESYEDKLITQNSNACYIGKPSIETTSNPIKMREYENFKGLTNYSSIIAGISWGAFIAITYIKNWDDKNKRK